MARNFPHISDSEFPDVSNVDVYKYRNDIDYMRFDYSQMDITICSVPWDMGEAHVGNRTISGIGNVVYFGSKEARDAWFASLDEKECFRFSTKLRQLHSANTIDVPLPFDIASKFNYCYVRYSLVANDSSPLQYEDADGLREWFWFIREVEFIAPNNTRLHLMADAWQTFIYDLDITGMMLERGHAPMVATDIESYIANPVGNASYLLAPDVDYGSESRIVRNTEAVVFNDKDTMAIIATSADISGTWGSKANNDWKTPGYAFNDENGYPGYYLFAIAVSSLATFITNVNSTNPQFLQTVQGIFFISSSLLNLAQSPVTFCSVACYPLECSSMESELYELDADDFGYPERYAGIAKLYTYPYAHIELTDENGNVTIVRIEETAGKLLLESSLNGLIPSLTLNCHVNGIGGNAGSTLEFHSIDKLSFEGSGKWYDALYSWNVPVFGITQDAGTNNDYATHFDRDHRKVAADNAYYAQDNIADNRVANASLHTTANTANNTADNTAVTANTGADRTLQFAQRDISNEVTSETVNNQIDYQYASGAIAAASALGGAAASAAAHPAGAIGAILGGLINAGAAMAATAASVNLDSNQAGMQILANEAGASAASGAMTTKLNTALANNNAHLSAANALTSGEAANDSATILANAVLQRGAEYNGIDCQIAGAKLNAPIAFGRQANADTAASRPLGLWANIVTESDYAIRRAGDEFLRYGYAYDAYWEFNGDWNACDKFTYWKLSDFWVKGLNIPDMYVDKIRFFLFGGVTVWSAPEYIGTTSIYENGL